MVSSRNCVILSVFFAVAFILLATCAVVQAQSALSPDQTLANAGPNATDADSAEGQPAASAALPADPAPQQSASASTPDGWRGTIAIYGWFPGVHGTVGVLGHEAGVSAPFSDVFHTLKGIIPVAVELDKGRWLIPVDFLWMKLGVDKGIPFNELGQTSVNVHLTQSILTPKVGYRLYDGEHLKVDALAGIRYWYVGQNLTVEPSGIGRSKSQSWVDGLGGARFTLPITPKAAVVVAGDAGGGGANLDYQVLGLLQLKLTPKFGAAVGWRYLDVDYRNGSNQFVYDMITSGAIAGFSYDFGGKPPVAPTASCSVSPAQVQAGEPVTAHVSTQNFNPKHTVDYKWSGSGLKLAGSGETASVDTTGLAPGRYTVSTTATDSKEKKNNTAICDSTFTVLQPPPQHPPVASCSASPGTVKAGDPAMVNVNASSPDGATLSYAYSSTAGSISGSGPSATLDTASAAPGSSVTATATVTDSRGLTASCTAMVNVLSAPVVVQQVTEVGECKFMNPKKPWRVDNQCKAVLDDVALRIQREPNGKLVVIGYSDDEETVDVQQLAAQRAVNVKYYLTAGEGKQHVDPSQVEPRRGSAKAKSAKFYFVPAGAQFTAEESYTVDETVVKGQPSNAPARRKAKKAASTPNQ